MYIVGVSSASKKDNTKKRKNVSQKEFIEYVGYEEEAASIASTQMTNAPSLLNVLALQDLESPLVKEREALEHAQNLVEDLESYRKQMLLGGDTTELLTSLKQKASKMRNNLPSSKLDSIVNEIETRAAIEAAKLESD